MDETSPSAVSRAHESGGVATMQQVAARAGVSVSTVSRALRNDDRVAASTLQRVRDAVAELDFRPNPNASRLRRGCSNVVALATPAVNDWYFATLIAGAQQELAARGYDIVVAASYEAGPLSRILSDAHPKVGRADAVIVIDLEIPDDLSDELAASGTAVVTIGFSLPQFASVGIDDVAVGRLATAHLIGLGHREIGVIGTAEDIPYRFPVPERRQRGYQTAMDEAGLQAGPILSGNFTIMGGYRAAEALLRRGDEVSALFCLSDKMAIGAMTALNDHGLRTPGDLSLIGVDDHSLAESFGLTTVRQPVDELGRVAADLALRAIQDQGNGPQHHILETELLLRSSTRRRA